MEEENSGLEIEPSLTLQLLLEHCSQWMHDVPGLHTTGCFSSPKRLSQSSVRMLKGLGFLVVVLYP